MNLNLVSREQSASSAVILNEVRDHKRPVLYSATRYEDGHIWVIDAILEQYRWYYWKELTNTPTDIVIDIYRQLKKGRLHHCNWGWAGISDGWFFDFSSIHFVLWEYDYSVDNCDYNDIFLGIEFVGQI